MNAMEKMAVQPTNEVVAKMLKDRNKGTEDCVTTSEVAREWGMERGTGPCFEGII